MKLLERLFNRKRPLDDFDMEIQFELGKADGYKRAAGALRLSMSLIPYPDTVKYAFEAQAKALEKTGLEAQYRNEQYVRPR